MTEELNKFVKEDSVDVLNAKINTRLSEFSSASDVVRSYELETNSSLASTKMIVSKFGSGFKFKLVKEN